VAERVLAPLIGIMMGSSSERRSTAAGCRNLMRVYRRFTCSTDRSSLPQEMIFSQSLPKWS
jgi:hypothetical protein